MYHIVVYLAFCFPVHATSVTQEPVYLPLDSIPLVIHTKKGKICYDVEIARTAEEKAHGLMYRRDFPETRTMLFVIPQNQKVAMWMANTPLSLDMLFMNSAGQILYLYTNAEPFSRTVISPMYPSAFVLEIKAGQVRKQGITIGQKVTHPAICGECTT